MNSIIHKRKHRILLVNPWIHDFAAFDLWAKPLGLLYITSILRREGFPVRLIDCLNPLHPALPSIAGKRMSGRGHFWKEEIPKPALLGHVKRRFSRYGIPPDLFRQELQNTEKPDLVFVTSMMTYWYPGVFEAIRIIRKILPGVPVVLGGIYASLCGNHARELSGADLVISGDVLSREAPSPLSVILSDMLGGEVSFEGLYDNLDSLPYPAFDLLPGLDHVVLATSKGCPYSCDYCASSFLQPSFQARDPLAVIEEIVFWKEHYGIRDFAFYDDALLINSGERALPMLDAITRRNVDCRFHCPNGLHIREMSAPLANLMYRAGFRTIRFGLETVDTRRQIETGGKVNTEEARTAIAYLKEAGYRSGDIAMYLLCGLPGQEPAEVRESIELVLSLGAIPVITEYSPIPRTALWTAAVSSSPYDIAGEPLFQNNTILPCGGDTMDLEAYHALKMAARAGRKTLIQSVEPSSIL